MPGIMYILQSTHTRLEYCKNHKYVF